MSTAERFLTAIVAGDRVGARTVVEQALLETQDVTMVYGTLVREALYEVGRSWQNGETTVAQEHAASATVQFVLSSVYSELPRSETRRGTAVVAGLPGELHQLGAHMVADVLDSDGWRVLFLGADVPTDALLDAIDDIGADLVALSMTMPAHLGQLASTIAALREAFGDRIHVIAGGQGWLGDDIEALGADAYSNDLMQAREIARGFSQT